MREATLSIGDRVLVRQVGLKGKHKLADRWEREPYTVVGMPNKTIPVYKVRKEGSDSRIRTLHRNMLLPFSAIPNVTGVATPAPTTGIPEPRKKVKRTVVPEKRDKPTANLQSDDSDQSDSVVVMPKYIIPQRRNQNITPSREIVQGTTTELSSNYGSTPSLGADVHQVYQN